MYLEEKAEGEPQEGWPAWCRIYGEPCVIAYYYGMWSSKSEWNVCKNYVVLPQNE